MSSMLVRGVKDEIGVFVNELLHSILNKFVEGVELLADETLDLEETGDDRPAILLGYLFVVLVILFIPHFISGLCVRLFIEGVRVLSSNEIKRVRRHMNTSNNQYTPWLIRTISTGESDYDVEKNGIFSLPYTRTYAGKWTRRTEAWRRDAGDRRG